MDKITLVTVKPAGKGKNIQRREFALADAQALLDYEKRARVKEWTLPENSPYTQDKDGRLIKRGGDQANKIAEESKGDTESAGEKGQA